MGNYTCDICNKTFTNKGIFTRHVKSHSLDPLIKWSGGKKDEIKHFIDYIPKTFNAYLEPFFGGGAVFFHLQPKKAYINDIHKELVSFYQAIKQGTADEIYNFMKANPNNEETYYHIRNQAESPSRFFYLRKTCFRGMLRYNNQGKFNIPFGRYKTINFNSLKDTRYHELFKTTEIFNTNFEVLFDEKFNNPSNFMFLDPPYDCIFNDYNGKGEFTKEHHRKLAELFKKTSIKCLMVIGHSEFIEELYSGYIKARYTKNYRFKLHSNRVNVNNVHLIITNYN